MTLAVSVLVAAGLGLVFTLAARAVARRFGFVAAPREDRWHSTPIALTGGLAIYAAFMTTFLALTPDLTRIVPVLVAASVLFVMGLIDDVRPLEPAIKLVAQLFAAALVVRSGLLLPWTGWEIVDAVVTIFWLIGITNALNLLDNMDGLAAGMAAIASSFLFVNFLLSGQVKDALLPGVLAGAAVGFLVFNFKPASIFMGDSGSMFLGFMLASTALVSDYGRSRSVAAVLFTPVLILLLPIFDTCLVTITRRLSGRAISQGGRDHTSHRLVAFGMSERRAVLMLYAFAVVSGLLAVAIRLLGTEPALLLVPAAGLMVLFLGLHLGKLVIYEQREQVPADSTIIRALAEFQYKRRVFEVLLDVVLVVLAYFAAYLLRFDGSLPREQMVIFTTTLPLIIGVQMLCFLLGGMYRGIWRYVGLDDLLRIGRSVTIAVAVTAVLLFSLHGFLGGASRVVVVLDWLLLFLFVSGSRLSFRLLRSMLGDVRPIRTGLRPVLIYGAGDGGELLLRELLNNGDYGFAPVAFIDDDGRKAGRSLHGVPIYSCDALQNLIARFGVTDVVISSAKVPESRAQELRSAGVSLRRMRIMVE